MTTLTGTPQLDTVYHSDALTLLRTMEDESVNCVVTSPPYFGLRDYGVAEQIGNEETPQQYVSKLVSVFSEIKRVLKADGNIWINLGDSYATSQKGSGGASQKQLSNAGSFHIESQRLKCGVPDKNLLGIPWRVAFALQDAGWILRSEIIWAKPAPMPESVTDRPTRSHEQIFLFAKSQHYYYDAQSIAEPCVNGDLDYPRGSKGASTPNAGRRLTDGTSQRKPYTTRNKRDVWTVSNAGFDGNHFATYPQKLIEPCIMAGCPVGGVVFDPFVGSGTTALVSRRLGRRYLGCDISAEYVAIAEARLAEAYTLPMFDRIEVAP